MSSDTPDDEATDPDNEGSGVDENEPSSGGTPREHDPFEDLGSEVQLNDDGTFDSDSEDDILGGLSFDSTAQIQIPDRLIDQVIGQKEAQEAVKKAARQGRHVMMIGSPGTGKSMLAKSMSRMMPNENLQDVLIKPNPDDSNAPTVETLPAGKGKQLVEMSRKQAQKQQNVRRFVVILIILAVLAYAILFAGRLLLGIIAAVIIYIGYKYIFGDITANTPNLLINSADKDSAPFEDATGAHAGALLGDVRHDPFQSGHLAVPAHERVEAGSIHKSDGGVLFIDEINTLDVRSQQKLMTAIQNGEFQITGQSERSSGAMVQTAPVPCNFVLVAAGNMDAMENMHPALRDRIRGYGYEVYMDDNIEDTPEMRRKYARFVAQEVKNDENIPHFTEEAVEEVIRESRRRAGRKGHLTLRLRNLGGLVRVAGDIARNNDNDLVQKQDVIDAKERSKSIESQVADEMIERKREYDISMTEEEVTGRVNGLAVYGESSGVLIPVMGEIAPSLSGGSVIATGKLQEIAKESVENVSALIKKLGGEELSQKDIHVQFVQTHEGVDGDSASITVATAVISALENIAVKQNVAMTGSLSVRGDVLPVGGVSHKIEAAAKSGLDTVIIPSSNVQDINIEKQYEEQVNIVPVTHLSEVLSEALVDTDEADELVEKVEEISPKPSVKKADYNGSAVDGTAKSNVSDNESTDIVGSGN